MRLRAGISCDQRFSRYAHAGCGTGSRLAVILLMAALVASVLPAARAARVDVMQALRSD